MNFPRVNVVCFHYAPPSPLYLYSAQIAEWHSGPDGIQVGG